MDWVLIIIVFVMTCTSLGYVAGVLVWRRGWPEGVCVLMAIMLAFIWPSVLVGLAAYSGYKVSHQALDPNFPRDAPGYVLLFSIFIGAPILDISGFLLPLVSAVIALRRKARLSEAEKQP
jgi:hypothetical protein